MAAAGSLLPEILARAASRKVPTPDSRRWRRWRQGSRQGTLTLKMMVWTLPCTARSAASFRLPSRRKPLNQKALPKNRKGLRRRWLRGQDTISNCCSGRRHNRLKFTRLILQRLPIQQNNILVKTTILPTYATAISGSQPDGSTSPFREATIAALKKASISYTARMSANNSWRAAFCRD